jgi:phosphatidylglycerophosphatase A
MKNRLTLLIATGLYTGYFPLMPATAGSALGVLILVLVGANLWYQQLLMILPGLAVAIWSAHRAENVFGVKDPGRVVVDEIVGIWISVAFLPINFNILLAGFLIFRVVDVIKPFPARRLAELPGGWGIVLDDVVAGIYTNLIIHAWLWLA